MSQGWDELGIQQSCVRSPCKKPITILDHILAYKLLQVTVFTHYKTNLVDFQAASNGREHGLWTPNDSFFFQYPKLSISNILTNWEDRRFEVFQGTLQDFLLEIGISFWTVENLGPSHHAFVVCGREKLKLPGTTMQKSRFDARDNFQLSLGSIASHSAHS